MERIEVFSPAKINLFLAVVGRMDDGYHKLVSLVAPLDFGDRVALEVEEAGAASVTLECSDSSLPSDERNLAYAAAARFLKRFDLAWQVRLRLEKRIPHGAGLGGGSSNASATLQGLSELAARRRSRPIAHETLFELGAELGSDCPLFLAQAPVVMRGRGERLSQLSEGRGKTLSGQRLLLFKPSVSIETAWAYGRLARSPDAFDDESWAEGRVKDWQSDRLALKQLLHNSFETVVGAKHLGVGLLLRRLRKRGIDCLMSGSGSCCFALVESDAEEEEARSIVFEAWGARIFVEAARVL